MIRRLGLPAGIGLALATLTLGCGMAAAVAQAGAPRFIQVARHFHSPAGHAHQYFDSRYHHDHYYPRRGFHVRHLPSHRIVINHAHRRYFYAGGVWYAPRASGFVVVGPPLGVFVTALPPFYTTLQFGGIPYYYANDTYYTWNDGRNAYEVVAPPPSVTSDSTGTTTAYSTNAPAPVDQLYVYPKNGQSKDQQATDKYQCHRWATGETGFDPTQSGGGVPAAQENEKRADYQRAMTACLEGRGYSVR